MSHFRGTVFSLLCLYLMGVSTLMVQATSAFFPRVKVTSLGEPDISLDTRTGRELVHHGSQPAPLSSMTSVQSLPPSLARSSATLLLRGGEVSEIATTAYEWCINLGNPSALVAGAVIATIYENIGSGALEIDDSDSKVVRFGKRLTRVLLLSAFALEVMSIFVTTVTGTMLLSKTEDMLDAMVEVSKDTTPLSFLRDNFEFEYLSARITFLQGLLNWIFAIALGHIIPNGESKQTRIMNKFIGSSLVLTVTLMLAFYNDHMNFYTNYTTMLLRWFHVTFQRFIWQWPPKPSILLSAPCFAYTMYMGYKAFFGSDQIREPKKEKEVVVTEPPASM